MVEQLMPARRVFMVDLADEKLAGEYEACHRPGGVPAQVLRDIRDTGGLGMEIYRLGDRLVMITEADGMGDVTARISSAESAAWEAKMERFQRPAPAAAPGIKWAEATRIFDINEHPDTNGAAS
jgi:L-rhamnose mutarotase